MTLTDRARIAEQIIKDLGDPEMVAVSFSDYEITIHTHMPLNGIGYKTKTSHEGTYYGHEYMEGDEQVRLCAYVHAEEVTA